MIRKIVHGSWFIVFSLPFLLNVPCFAQPINSNELIENAKQYDGKIVIYEGEVIGEVMARAGFMWVNINDGNNAVGIWAHKDLTKEISYTGTYKAKGDWVEAIGVFHRACPEHGGDLDIHAQSIRKINPGRQIKERLNIEKRNFSFILLGILLIVWILKQLSWK